MTTRQLSEYALKLLPVKPPFSNWAPPSLEIPYGLYGFFELSAWTYQLFIYGLTVEEKFGADVAGFVRQHVSIFIRADLDNKLEPFFQAIDHAYAGLQPCIYPVTKKSASAAEVTARD